MAVVVDQLTEDWATLPAKQFERNVYRLQKRIYQAARRGDLKCASILHSFTRTVTNRHTVIGAYDKSRCTEEPSAGKLARSVRKWRRGG